MNPVKRMLLVVAATAMLLLAFTAVAGAQQSYPPAPGPGVSGGSANTTTSSGSQIAFTGSDHSTELALGGAAAVLLGAGLVVMTRRQRSVAQV